MSTQNKLNRIILSLNVMFAIILLGGILLCSIEYNEYQKTLKFKSDLNAMIDKADENTKETNDKILETLKAIHHDLTGN